MVFAAVPAAGSQSDEAELEPVTWQSAGDSYSSGEGVFGNIGECAQSDRAYGPLAASILSQDWQFGSVTFTACTGHVVEDYFVARTGEMSLWDRGIVEQGGPERVDIITMSFGGNDIGFGDMLKDCLDIPIVGDWNDFLQLGDIRTGCDTSEGEVEKRIDALLDPPETCTGTRPSGSAGYLCDLNLGDRRGSIADFYFDVVTQRLTADGRLYIVGYPRLVAPVAEWPGWIKVDCQEILRGDSERLGRLAEYLDAALREAVTRANMGLGEDRVVFVDRLEHFRENQAELCGSGTDWINGIAIDRGEGLNFRPETSFHVNAEGHAATASRLVDLVRSTFTPRRVQAAERMSSFGVSYVLPQGIEWTRIGEQSGSAEVIYLGGGNSTVALKISQGSLIENTVTATEATFEGLVEEGWWETVPEWLQEVEVPGATRAVRFFPPPSGSGDGVAEVLMMEAGGLTIEASTYLYIEDLGVLSPEELSLFLGSIEIDPDGLPSMSAPNAVTGFRSPTGNIQCELTERSVRCDLQEHQWAVPDAIVTDCRASGLDDPHTVAVSEGKAAVSCAGGILGEGERPVLEYGDRFSLGAVTCLSEFNGVTCGDGTGAGFFVARERYEIW